MRRTIITSVFCLAWLAISVAGPVSSLKFSVLDTPGAIRTTARGISNETLIVGDHTDPAAGNKGYLRLDKSAFASTPISIIWVEDSVSPVIEAVSTTVSGINDVRWLVGNYRDRSSVSHGFLYDTSNPLGYPSYQPISVFEASFTDAVGINKGTMGNGWNPRIVGSYVDPAGISHGCAVPAGAVGNAQGAPLTPGICQTILHAAAAVPRSASCSTAGMTRGSPPRLTSRARPLLMLQESMILIKS